MLVCWLLGHEPEPYAYAYGLEECGRCGGPSDRPLATHTVYFYGLLPFLLPWLEPLREWCRHTWWACERCRECGEPFRWGHRPWCEEHPDHPGNIPF